LQLILQGCGVQSVRVSAIGVAIVDQDLAKAIRNGDCALAVGVGNLDRENLRIHIRSDGNGPRQIPRRAAELEIIYDPLQNWMGLDKLTERLEVLRAGSQCIEL